ncbi:Smr/MutS family protein, partial [Chloroflexota bacterium]
IEQAKAALSAVQEQLKSEVWQPKVGGETDEEVLDGESIAVGDMVWLKEANIEATVLSVSEKTQQVEVQAGLTKIQLGLHSVEKVRMPSSRRVPDLTMVTKQLAGRTVAVELDLRGKRADEVEWALDSYLNDAALANLGEVRIIHGFGTGTVRGIVREFLATNPLVKSFRPGGRGEGGDGVTIVRL